MIIAIDGFSSTGKSTLARQLAAHLNYLYIDSGAMYRAISLYVIQNDMLIDFMIDKASLIKSLPDIKIDIRHETDKENQVMMNGENVTSQLRDIKVSNMVSEVAAIPEVREKLVSIQRKLSRSTDIVMDGRDIGTVVFPHADLKLFIKADALIRAERRWMEMREKGDDVDFDDILSNIKQRDIKDTTRKIAPLKKADDAIELDNTSLDKKQQLDFAIQYVNDLKH
jgi:cytidylate kinase